MNYLNSYLRSKLDLSNIGFQRGEKWSNYFCTPVLSKVIGWAGVDGIHFCTTKGFDEIIFAVSPENLPGEYVHPVARNFEDFLRLLLACYDTAAIEQCWFMDREVFEDFLTRNQPDAEGQKCLDEIRKKYKLTPMEDPFTYMHKLQEEFDYDALRFPPEYYEIVEEPAERPAPEWKVTWDGDFLMKILKRSGLNQLLLISGSIGQVSTGLFPKSIPSIRASSCIYLARWIPNSFFWMSLKDSSLPKFTSK